MRNNKYFYVVGRNSSAYGFVPFKCFLAPCSANEYFLHLKLEYPKDIHTFSIRKCCLVDELPF